MKRMEVVLRQWYGNAAYNASDQPDWVLLAKKKKRIPVPTQGYHECGFYMLRYANYFDGEKMVYERPENKKKYKQIVENDVSELYSKLFAVKLHQRF